VKRKRNKHRKEIKKKKLKVLPVENQKKEKSLLAVVHDDLSVSCLTALVTVADTDHTSHVGLCFSRWGLFLLWAKIGVFI
jgi:hypothetical protein